MKLLNQDELDERAKRRAQACAESDDRLLKKYRELKQRTFEQNCGAVSCDARFSFNFTDAYTLEGQLKVKCPNCGYPQKVEGVDEDVVELACKIDTAHWDKKSKRNDRMRITAVVITMLICVVATCISVVVSINNPAVIGFLFLGALILYFPIPILTIVVATKKYDGTLNSKIGLAGGIMATVLMTIVIIIAVLIFS